MPPTRPLLVLFPALVAIAAAQSPAPASDPESWRRCLAADAVPPAASELPQRLRELNLLLASPDPVLRDELGFAVLVRWLYRDRIVPVALRRELLTEWTASLRHGIDGTGTDDVTRRSFAALSLSLLVALDNEEPYLERAEFAALLGAALDYLQQEPDVRGFDARLGWLHAVAHTADLLKHLARSRHLEAADQARILAAIQRRLATLAAPLVHGEDERLARVLLSLIARSDFEVAAFTAWLPAAWQPPGAVIDGASLARAHNQRHLMLSLLGLLQIDRRSLPQAATVHTALTELLRARQDR
jgi:hypothetical protein